MEDAVRDYVENIQPEHRPLFDRLHGLILAEHPDTDVGAVGPDPYTQGRQAPALPRAWQHGASIYVWGTDHDGGFPPGTRTSRPAEGPTAAQCNIRKAKTILPRIIERVEHGEKIIISRAGHR
jgi:hypothetical protein